MPHASDFVCLALCFSERLKRQMSRALGDMIAQTARRDGSIWLLYGLATERSPNHNARECHDASKHPQERRTGDRLRTLETMTNISTRETRGDDRTAPHVDRTWVQCPPSGHLRRAAARESWMPRARRRPDPNNSAARSSLMLSSSLAATPDIERLGRAPPLRIARARRSSQPPRIATRSPNLPG